MNNEEKMNPNMRFYNAARTAPKEYTKRLSNGLTGTNMQWKIEKMTEMFGPCGVGWWYTIAERWVDTFEDYEKIANVKIHLQYRDPLTGIESKPLEAIGEVRYTFPRSVFRDNSECEKYNNVNDEAYKMATTDALSRIFATLGIGADTRYGLYEGKYDVVDNTPPELDKTEDGNDKEDNEPPQNLSDKVVELNEQGGQEAEEVTKEEYIEASETKVVFYDDLLGMTLLQAEASKPGILKRMAAFRGKLDDDPERKAMNAAAKVMLKYYKAHPELGKA